MRLGITGGRSYLFDAEDTEWLVRQLEEAQPVEIHLGDCLTGVDREALSQAFKAPQSCLRVVIHRALWGKDDRAAGPRRNARLVSEIDRLLVFPGGRGTQSCVNHAQIIGVEIRYRDCFCAPAPLYYFCAPAPL